MNDEARFHIGGVKATCRMTKRRASEVSRIFEKLDHPFEQTTGTAAIDTAMVEA